MILTMRTACGGPLAKADSEKSNDAALVAQTDEEGRELARLHDAYKDAVAAAKTITRSPDGPDATAAFLVLGKYQCFCS